MKAAPVTLAALLLLATAACAGDDGQVRIEGFDLERAEPPADARGGSILVLPRAALHLRWQVRGDVRRVVLAANDRTIADFTGQIPRSAVDRCDAGSCGTWSEGEVEYRLTAWDAEGRRDSRTLAVRVSEQGLQVLSFTTDPESVERGASVTLAWETAGATEARLEATPLGGGPSRSLGTFSGQEARSGSLVDRNVGVATLYRLVIGDGSGREKSAEVALPIRGEAWLTHVEASPGQVAAGEPVTLAWRSVGLDRLVILRDDAGETIDDVAPAELAEGTRTVTVTRPTWFAFVGASEDGALVTDVCDDTGCRPARVQVEMRAGPAVLAFTADEREIPAGDGTTLRWQVTGADEVVIAWTDAAGAQERRFAPEEEAWAIVPEDSTRYTLVAHGAGRTASRHLLVGVRPAVELEAPEETAPGEPLPIRWTTRGAQSLELRLGGSLVDVAGEPVAGGSVAPVVDPATLPGSLLEVVLTARDGETPRRVGQATVQVRVVEPEASR